MDNAFLALKNIIMDKLIVEEKEITPEARFDEDFGADSLDKVEILMAVEDRHNIEIPDEDAEKFLTVGDAVEYLKSRGIK